MGSRLILKSESSVERAGGSLANRASQIALVWSSGRYIQNSELRYKGKQANKRPSFSPTRYSGRGLEPRFVNSTISHKTTDQHLRSRRSRTISEISRKFPPQARALLNKASTFLQKASTGLQNTSASLRNRAPSYKTRALDTDPLTPPSLCRIARGKRGEDDGHVDAVPRSTHGVGRVSRVFPSFESACHC